jgi:hypothetical protein
VIAAANPLRGVISDSDHLRTILATLPGPIVVIGHSYRGALITNAATGNPDAPPTPWLRTRRYWLQTISAVATTTTPTISSSVRSAPVRQTPTLHRSRILP